MCVCVFVCVCVCVFYWALNKLQRLLCHDIQTHQTKEDIDLILIFATSC